MADEKHIEELFKESFDSFEATVDPGAWSGISQQLNQTGTASSTTAAAKSLFGAKGLFFGGMVVAAVTAGVFGYLTGKEDAKQAAEEPEQSTAISSNEKPELSVQQSGVISEPIVPVTEDPPVLRNEIRETPENQTIRTEKRKEAVIESQQTDDLETNSWANNFITQPGKTYYQQAESSAENQQEKDQQSTNYRQNDHLEEQPGVSLEIKVYPSGGYSPFHASFDAEGEFDRIRWDFGDGQTSMEKAPVHVYYEPGNYVVVVLAEKDGEKQEKTLEIAVTEGSRMKIPNIVTPNGDGENDRFRVVASGMKEFRMIVSNMNGETLFVATHPDQAWNCEYQGRLVDRGNYLYVISGLGEDGKQYNEKGMLRVNY